MQRVWHRKGRADGTPWAAQLAAQGRATFSWAAFACPHVGLEDLLRLGLSSKGLPDMLDVSTLPSGYPIASYPAAQFLPEGQSGSLFSSSCPVAKADMSTIGTRSEGSQPADGPRVPSQEWELGGGARL